MLREALRLGRLIDGERGEPGKRVRRLAERALDGLQPGEPLGMGRCRDGQLQHAAVVHRTDDFSRIACSEQFQDFGADALGRQLGQAIASARQPQLDLRDRAGRCRRRR